MSRSMVLLVYCDGMTFSLWMGGRLFAAVLHRHGGFSFHFT